MKKASGCLTLFWNVLRQSVLFYSVILAFVAAGLTVLASELDANPEYRFLKGILPDDNLYQTARNFIVILLVFRTVQSVNVYRSGATMAYQMLGAWFDSASTLIAFTRFTSVDPEHIMNFKHTLVRLFSLLNMLCLSELENPEEGEAKALEFALLDIEGLDTATLVSVANAKAKAETVCQQIQCLVIDNISTGVLSVPPPILSRSFQDLGNGMLRYHEALSLAKVPLPLPLRITTNLILIFFTLYNCLATASWCSGSFSSGGFAFITTLAAWTLHGTACELENPFNGDINDVQTQTMQCHLNVCLMELLEQSSAPTPTTVKSKWATKPTADDIKKFRPTLSIFDRASIPDAGVGDVFFRKLLQKKTSGEDEKIWDASVSVADMYPRVSGSQTSSQNADSSRTVARTELGNSVTSQSLPPLRRNGAHGGTGEEASQMSQPPVRSHGTPVAAAQQFGSGLPSGPRHGGHEALGTSPPETLHLPPVREDESNTEHLKEMERRIHQKQGNLLSLVTGEGDCEPTWLRSDMPKGACSSQPSYLL